MFWKGRIHDVPSWKWNSIWTGLIWGLLLLWGINWYAWCGEAGPHYKQWQVQGCKNVCGKKCNTVVCFHSWLISIESGWMKYESVFLTENAWTLRFWDLADFLIQNMTLLGHCKGNDHLTQIARKSVSVMDQTDDFPCWQTGCFWFSDSERGNSGDWDLVIWFKFKKKLSWTKQLIFLVSQLEVMPQIDIPVDGRFSGSLESLVTARLGKKRTSARSVTENLGGPRSIDSAPWVINHF